MPPKVKDNQTTSAESLHAVTEETAVAARRIVATYAKDFLDATTLMSMLGVEPEGLIHRKVAAEYEEPEPAKKPAKKGAKKTTKKTTKTTAKKSTARKTTKSTAKKSTK